MAKHPAFPLRPTKPPEPVAPAKPEKFARPAVFVRRIGPEKFDVVSGILVGELSDVKVREHGVSLVVALLSARALEQKLLEKVMLDFGKAAE
jgi:hypothetical protein